MPEISAVTVTVGVALGTIVFLEVVLTLRVAIAVITGKVDEYRKHKNAL